MAMHPDIQERLYEEIMDAIEKNNGKIDVELASTIDYLNGVIHESLRILPFMLFHQRICTQDIEVMAKMMHGVMRIPNLLL